MTTVLNIKVAGTPMAKLASLKQEWLDAPVHPAAATLPMMGDAEIDELAADIKKNGLQQRLIYWRDNRDQPTTGEKGKLYLLDGRGRLAAIKRLGIVDADDAKVGWISEVRTQTLHAIREADSTLTKSGIKGSDKWVTEVDPWSFVMSLNVHRRHLTGDQKREVIEAIVKANPLYSDRKVGRLAGADNKTVAEVRNGQNEEIPQNDQHDPAARALEALRADPSMSKRALMAAASVSSGTAVKARKALEEAGEISPKPPRESQPKPPRAKQPETHTTQPEKDESVSPKEARHAELAGLIKRLGEAINALASYPRDQISKASFEKIDALADTFNVTVSNLGKEIK